MRLISFSASISLALISSAALAQQSPTTGDTIGRPPPLAGPPPISEPSSTPPPPRATEPAPKSDTYVPAALPEVYTGPGRDVVGADGSTKTVKAVPCGRAARETDGFTTCVGIPDKSTESPRR